MKIIALINIFFAIVLMFNGCNRQRDDEQVNERREVLERQAQYASRMGFDNIFGWGSSRWIHRNDLDERDIIFVRSMEEALAMEHSWDIIVAWPSPFTIGVMEALNKIEFDYDLLTKYDATFDILELALPLTVDDIINNWQSIQHLVNVGLTPDNNTIIREHATSYREETNDAFPLIRLLFNGLENINKLALEMERKPSEVNLEWINGRGGTDFTLYDLPRPPFTEEDARNNPRLIEAITIILLTREVWNDISLENVLRRQFEQSNE